MPMNETNVTLLLLIVLVVLLKDASKSNRPFSFPQAKNGYSFVATYGDYTVSWYNASFFIFIIAI